ncbi:MAG: bifunctional diaminohydroxyphosphoribosylaminopyrimidine deaminase/5-amino-6-(5-phosphoribosylamino)uracil reductase RibD [Fimbriimonadaceae bacterium]
MSSPFMALAAELAGHGWPAPNPRVGCVLVSSGRVVGRGHHERKGTAHAEVVALRDAGELARGATAFVTLEPCDHQGLTPPCSLALLEAGVSRVVFAEHDPNPKAGGGAQRLREAGIEVVHEPCKEASAVNVAFLAAQRMGRPYVMAKAALTADGFMARPDGTSKWITGDVARAAGHGLRAEAGTVLVGAETAVLDEPQLTVRAFEPGWQPQRFVIDPHRRVGSGSPLFAGEPARRVVTSKDAGEDELGVPQRDGSLDLDVLVEILFAQGLTSVLIEGGPTTIQRFAIHGLIDRFDLFTAPAHFGEGRRLALPQGLALSRVRCLGPDVWATYTKPGEPAALPEWERSLRR